MNSEPMLTIDEVAEFFGGKGKPLHQSTIYRWVQEGKLPRAIGMSSHTKRWRLSDCQRVLDAMMTASNPSEPV